MWLDFHSRVYIQFSFDKYKEKYFWQLYNDLEYLHRFTFCTQCIIWRSWVYCFIWVFVKSYNLVFLYYLVIYIFPNLVPNEYCVHLYMLHKDLTKSQWSSLTINFVCTVEKSTHKYFRFCKRFVNITNSELESSTKNLVLLHFV